MSRITSAEGAQQRRLAKGKTIQYDPNAPKTLTVFYATNFPAWQDRYMALIQEGFEKLGVFDLSSIANTIDKKDVKKAMPFLQNVKKRLDSGEKKSHVFDRKLPFDERAVLAEMVPAVKQVVQQCKDIVIIAVKEGSPSDERPPVAETAVPGTPAFYFENV